MSSFLLNWVNKRPIAQKQKSLKKVALKYTDIVVENVESSDCDAHIPTCWNKSLYNGLKSSYNWLIVENKKLGCVVYKKIIQLGLFGEKISHF